MDYARDVATFEVRYAERIGENWFGRAGEGARQRHRWNYWSDMDFKEALLFKQWDRYTGHPSANFLDFFVSHPLSRNLRISTVISELSGNSVTTLPPFCGLPLWMIPKSS